MAVNSVIGELIKGQESARDLKELLARIFLPAEINGADSSLAWGLLDGILGSFSRARIALEHSSCNALAEIDCDRDHRSEECSGKKKIQRRSGYRRRAHPYSSKQVLNKTIDDGFAWRKYGQKIIFSSKFPRSYFRCTHKYDKDCQATRQVQQSEEDPSLFVITYMGEHTCRDTAPKSGDQRPSFVIDFESNAAADRQSPCFLPPLHSLKQESDGEVISNSTLDFSSSEPPMLPEVKTSSDHHSDVTSAFNSPYGFLDMEFGEADFALDDILSLDLLQDY
ncbi:transcription factor WRKY45-1-like [Typha latifolia]|uniref:transcription factor WRKY45-1-like n=1 Tax=Typha latifolia TaxID=4733 RepID=UPI003C2FF61F